MIDPELRPAPERKGGAKDRTYPTAAKALKAWLGGKGFVPHTQELLRSSAWQQRSIYAVRFIELLEREYLGHAGREKRLSAGDVGADAPC